MANELPPPPESQRESSLYARMTEGTRDPVRDEYVRRVGVMAGTQQMTRAEVLLPGTRIMPPWKID